MIHSVLVLGSKGEVLGDEAPPADCSADSPTVPPALYTEKMGSHRVHRTLVQLAPDVSGACPVARVSH